MAIAETSVVALRIFGDDLVPSEVTRLLGCEPTAAYAKGDTRIGLRTGKGYIEKSGSWRLNAMDRQPADIPSQIEEIFSKLTQDAAVWNQLKSTYTLDFFCGLFMGSSNDMLEFSPDLLGKLSERGIILALDIYGPVDD